MNDDQKQNFDYFNRKRETDLAKRRALNTDYNKNNGQPQNKNDYASSQKADQIGRQKLNTSHANQREDAETSNKNQYAQGEKGSIGAPQSTPQQKAENLNTARREDLQKKSEDKNPEKNKNDAPSKNPISNLKNKLSQTKETVTGIAKSPVWMVAFVAAIACDICDIFVIAAWPITFFVRPFLIIFLFFHGSWGQKFKRVGATLVDFIPVIGFAPISTWCVYDAYKKSQQKKSNI